MILRDQAHMQEILAAHALWLRGAGGNRADLRGADLHGADLHGADLYGAALRRADLHGANLHGADLYGADLRSADLCRADLRGADLRSADLRGADLRSADLRGAVLRDAHLRGAVLRGCTKAIGVPAKRATRSDGHEFFLWPTDQGWRIGAGCRWFTPAEARAHWMNTRPRIGGEMGDETHDILDFFDAHIARSAAP